MRSEKCPKDVVIVVHGHKYTFFSNGVYLCAELLDLYDVVLVVPQSFSEDEKFLKLCEIVSFRDVVYFPSNTYLTSKQKDRFYGINIVKQLLIQAKYSRMGQMLILEYEPVALIQHDYINVENMYFFHWANHLRKHCNKIVVLSTAPSNERTLAGFGERRRGRALKMVNNRILGTILSGLVTSFKLLESVIRNIVIPALVLKRAPYFGLSRFDNIDIKPKTIQFDYFMVFERAEEIFYGSLFGDPARVKRILSPIANSTKINSQLFHVKSVKDIVILFSLTSEKGFDTVLLDRWCDFIAALYKKYPKSKFIIKDHPGMPVESSLKFKGYIQLRCDYVDFVTSDMPDISVESLILNSWLVVGDSSSVLPWAIYCGGKIVLSMDIGNSRNSRDMEPYSGITLFSRHDDFSRIVDNIASGEILESKQLPLPSVCAFIF